MLGSRILSISIFNGFVVTVAVVIVFIYFKLTLISQYYIDKLLYVAQIFWISAFVFVILNVLIFKLIDYVFEKRKTVLLCFYVSVALLFGIFGGCLMVMAAWDHNPQNVFHDDARIAYADLFKIFVSWFMIVGFYIFLSEVIGAILYFAGKRCLHVVRSL
jgi:hypothetical protein